MSVALLTFTVIASFAGFVSVKKHVNFICLLGLLISMRIRQFNNVWRAWEQSLFFVTLVFADGLTSNTVMFFCLWQIHTHLYSVWQIHEYVMLRYPPLSIMFDTFMNKCSSMCIVFDRLINICSLCHTGRQNQMQMRMNTSGNLNRSINSASPNPRKQKICRSYFIYLNIFHGKTQ